MFGLDSPKLLGSRPAVLAVTLPSNKFYLLYVLPCVCKFFSNPRSDHDSMEQTSLQPSEGTNPDDTDFRLPASRTVRQDISVV